jgi:hypothetical protein
MRKEKKLGKGTTRCGVGARHHHRGSSAMGKKKKLGKGKVGWGVGPEPTGLGLAEVRRRGGAEVRQWCPWPPREGARGRHTAPLPAASLPRAQERRAEQASATWRNPFTSSLSNQRARAPSKARQLQRRQPLYQQPFESEGKSAKQSETTPEEATLLPSDFQIRRQERRAKKRDSARRGNPFTSSLSYQRTRAPSKAQQRQRRQPLYQQPFLSEDKSAKQSATAPEEATPLPAAFPIRGHEHRAEQASARRKEKSLTRSLSAQSPGVSGRLRLARRAGGGSCLAAPGRRRACRCDGRA